MSAIYEAGRLVYDEYIARKPFSLMARDFAPKTADEAYAIQEVYTALKAETASGFGGYKIAYTTPQMQAYIGATEPAHGRILRHEIYPSPTRLNPSDYAQLEVECEVAVRIVKDLIDGPFDDKTVDSAIGEIMLAFEVVDRRPFLGEKSELQSIAMNVIGAGVILGKPVADWRNLDIAGSECRLKVNDEVIGTGLGSDVNGHPVQPIYWLAESLASKGDYLKRGDVVITGSMIPPHGVEAGDVTTLEMDHLGTVELFT